MKKVNSLIIILLPFFLTAQLQKFENVQRSELLQTKCLTDSEADAMYLFRTSYSRYEFNTKGQFELTTTYRERIKVFSEDGFKYASKRIALRKNRKKDDDIKVEGTLYYYYKDKIRKHNFSSSQLKIDKENDYWNYASFKFDNVKVGCVVEWEYTIESPFLSMLPEFKYQSVIPTKYFDSTVRINDRSVFRYNTIGDCSIDITETVDFRNIEYYGNLNNAVISNQGSQGGRFKVNENVVQSIGHDIPAFKAEPYSGSYNKLACRTTFELVSFTNFNGQIVNYTKDWADVSKSLNDDASFGGELSKTSYFQDDLSLMMSESDKDSLAYNIYNYVRERMTWNGAYSVHAIDKLKDAYENSEATSGEINLILVAMLRAAGISANPIATSTRSHGIPVLPTTQGFNHVIASVVIDDELFLLDATEKKSPYGVLKLDVINWLGRLIQENGDSKFISLRPKVLNKSSHFVSASLNDDGSLSGEMNISFDNHDAIDFLEKYGAYTNDDFVGVFEKKMNFRCDIEKIVPLNKNNFEGPLRFNATYNANKCVNVNGDKIYISSLLFLVDEKSLFTNERRLYPIDFIVPWEKKFVINLQIPSGYEVDKLPEDLILKLPENRGEMKFVCHRSGTEIKILSQVSINSPIFSTDYYDVVKDFFDDVSQKQNEKIVFKKIE